jgi:uncharacterized protein YggE
MSQQLLTVQGYGSVSATPDQAVISFEVKNSNRDYAKCVDGLNRMTDEFFKVVKSAGIKDEQIKMSDFEVRDVDEYSEDRRSRVFAGYAASYSFKLRLDLDHKLINRVLNAVSRTSGRIRIGLDFTVKDAQSFKDQALEKAITNAKAKAEVIIKATGVNLGKIQHVNYGREIVQITSRRMGMSLRETMSPIPENREINPEDVSAGDYVSITWEIEG